MELCVCVCHVAENNRAHTHTHSLTQAVNIMQTVQKGFLSFKAAENNRAQTLAQEEKEHEERMAKTQKIKAQEAQKSQPASTDSANVFGTFTLLVGHNFVVVL